MSSRLFLLKPFLLSLLTVLLMLFVADGFALSVDHKYRNIEVSEFKVVEHISSDIRVGSISSENTRTYPNEVRVFPVVTGKFDRLRHRFGGYKNRFNDGDEQDLRDSLSIQMTITSGDGVYGAPGAGLFHLFKRGDQLVARFIVDLIRNQHYHYVIGSVDENGVVTMEDRYKLQATFYQEETNRVRERFGTGSNSQRVFLAVQGLRAIAR